MDIDRKERQTGNAQEKIKFCLDLLEKESFKEGISWDTCITDRLTLEEIIGALVHAEQEAFNVRI